MTQDAGGTWLDGNDAAPMSFVGDEGKRWMGFKYVCSRGHDEVEAQRLERVIRTESNSPVFDGDPLYAAHDDDNELWDNALEADEMRFASALFCPVCRFTYRRGVPLEIQRRLVRNGIPSVDLKDLERLSRVVVGDVPMPPELPSDIRIGDTPTPD